MTSSHLHRVLRILSCVLLGIIFFGCSELTSPSPDPAPGPDPNPGPTPTPPPPTEEIVSERHFRGADEDNDGTFSIEMDEKTIYVREDIGSTLKGYDEENGIITFGNSEALEKLNVKVGDYLYSTDRTETFPNGYCFEVTGIKTTKAPDGGSSGGGSAIGTELSVDPAYLTDVIDYFNGKVGIDWQNLDESRITAYEFDGLPDFKHISDQIVDEALFKKRPLGNGFKIKPGFRKTTIEYTIWENGDGKDWELDPRHAHMKLAVVATLNHDIKDPLIQINRGDFLLDVDSEFGATLSLQFSIDGENMNMEKLTKDQRKAFLKEFEKDQERVLGRQIRLAHIELPSMPAKLIINPNLDLLWDFRIDKIGGQFKFTVGYTGAIFNLHYERESKGSEKLVDNKLFTQKQEAEWVLDVEGELEGEVSTGPMVCFSIEIPAMMYTGNYKTVHDWNNYKGRVMPSFVGAYVEFMLSGSFKLIANYDLLSKSLFTKFILSLKAKLNFGVEYLLGFSKLLIGHESKSVNLKESDWGTYEYTIEETNVGEYCVSPEVGSFIPEGDPVTLQWGTTREEGNKIVYTIFMGNTEDNMPVLKYNCKAGERYQYDGEKPLSPGKYYWYVVGTYPNGDKVESETWFFTVGNSSQEVQYLRAIDLELPSGLTWGDRNIDAAYNSDHGQFYQWGSTTSVTGKAFWDNYKWSNSDGTQMKKYNFDDCLMVLQSEDDPAVANTDRTGWRTPTKEEWEELRTYCSWTLSERNGVPGYIVKNDSNGAYIFLPIQTKYIGKDGELSSDGGLYWSASRSNGDNPYVASAVKVSSSAKATEMSQPRYLGLMVRPVFTGNMIPGMQLSETTLDFGDVAQSSEKSIVLSVKNIGNATMYFTPASITSPFTCKQYMTTISLDPAGTAFLNITFAPGEVKDYEGVLLISSNAAGGTHKVTLKGKGVTKNDGGIDDVPGENL